jgi:hypothetical protein
MKLLRGMSYDEYSLMTVRIIPFDPVLRSKCYTRGHLINNRLLVEREIVTHLDPPDYEMPWASSASGYVRLFLIERVEAVLASDALSNDRQRRRQAELEASRRRVAFEERRDRYLAEWWVVSRLCSERGWTPQAVDRFLGEPDHLVPMERYSWQGQINMRIYHIDRVRTIEASEDWQEWSREHQDRVQRLRAAKAKRRMAKLERGPHFAHGA